jgi:1,4-dihydroxy-2-naphthoyl-CoA hydrolase
LKNQAPYIWFKDYNLEDLQGAPVNEHMDTNIGIEFFEIGPDFLKLRMPITDRVRQPLGLLHGGANCVLAESAGSIASWLCIDQSKQIALGLEINANHIRSVREGAVIAKCQPIHIGRQTHVWDIKITDETSGKLTCVSRLTVQIVEKSKSSYSIA